ncbi:hypothetical protein ACFV4N_08275 [Actinosynnema sp. NPDC059797]
MDATSDDSEHSSLSTRWDDLEPDADDVEAQAAAERLHRRLADQRQVELLREDGFAGPRYEWFATELVGYGVAVLHSWILRGTIYQRTAEWGRPVTCPDSLRENLHRSADSRQELIGEVVAHALRKFRQDALEGGEWSFDGGASLRTFFLNACVFAFPAVFRRWVRENEYRLQTAAYGLAVESESGLLLACGTFQDPADAIATYDWIHKEIAKAQRDQLQEALRAIIFDDADHRTIAKRLGIKVDAVKKMLQRHKDESLRRREGRERA